MGASKSAGLLDGKTRGVWRLTEKGKNEISNRNLTNTDITRLMSINFISELDESSGLTNPDKTSRELLEESHTQLRNSLVQDLLQKIKECSLEFFERLAMDLLLKMGYGGARSDAGRAIGKTGDGGVDGIISEDRLGLDNICIQAKRWDDATVGQSEIRNFVGAIVGHHGTKGAFITTSTFTKNAKTFAQSVPNLKIKLIDGNKLTQFMIDFDIGTSKEKTYILKE